MIRLIPLLCESVVSWEKFAKACSTLDCPMYPDETVNDDDFNPALFPNEEAAVDTYKDMTYQFDELPNPIPIYRLLSINDVSEIRLDAPGEHWTYDKDNLQALLDTNVVVHLGKLLVVLSGFVAKKDVDWERTARLYVEFSSDMCNTMEKEICVTNDWKIKNVTYELYKK